MAGGSTARRRRGLALLAATLATCAGAEKDSVVKLTKFNFDSNVRHGSWFVKFYAPWCTHCQRLAPIWEKLADQAAAKDWPVKIAEVDCTSSKAVCEKAEVKAFPMLALIGDGIVKGKYQGEASVSHFEEWLNMQKVLKASGEAMGERPVGVTSDAKDGSQPTASHIKAVTAVISNFLARFPTKSKIINIYIHGGIGLAILVALLCTLFRLLDAQDAEHEKEG